AGAAVGAGGVEQAASRAAAELAAASVPPILRIWRRATGRAVIVTLSYLTGRLYRDSEQFARAVAEHPRGQLGAARERLARGRRRLEVRLGPAAAVDDVLLAGRDAHQRRQAVRAEAELERAGAEP